MSTTETVGVLDVTSGGAGFVRRKQNSYLASDGDTYVPQKLIQRYKLRTGDELVGEAGPSPGRGKNPPLVNLVTVNGLPPEEMANRPEFHRLSALHPKDQLVLECELDRGTHDHTNRIIDLFCPFGKGQRAMIVAPAKAGKTMVLQAVAEGLVKNYPNSSVFILLVDERPEEVTEMEMCGYGEVVASSFDHPADRHVGVAEITLERARRRVEMGQDVIIILDSITRLARAYNTNERSSGKTLTGGLDSNALEKPKRFLGSARNIDPKQGGGSLTIIATALVETGSRMDDVIFEEFKGTGNSELVLSRELADKRIWPAIDLTASATRREELLLSPEALQTSHKLRRDFSDMSPPEAMDQLLARMKRTKTNDELVQQITSGRV
ncbi:MAG TPA: transcription termination factor Rho [Longimicrobiales bacterium]|nr:transcription termination factor Rho [Longimicrobiales bacterium]